MSGIQIMAQNEKSKTNDKLDFIYRCVCSNTPDGGFSRENTYLNKKESQLFLWPGIVAWFDSYWERRSFTGNRPHHDLVFTLIVSGRMRYEYEDGTVVTYQPGEFIFPRYVGNDIAGNSRKSIVRVRKEEPLYRLGLILKRNPVILALLSHLNSNGRRLLCTDPETVKNIMLAMKEEICAKDGSSDKLGILLLKLLEELLRQKEARTIPLALHKALDCVAKEGCLLSLERLVEVSGVSTRTLQNLFQKYYHCCPKKYLADQKFEYAKTLLHSQSLVISEIASLCGFSSAESFSRSFKAHTGKSPRDFMK